MTEFIFHGRQDLTPWTHGSLNADYGHLVDVIFKKALNKNVKQLNKPQKTEKNTRTLKKKVRLESEFGPSQSQLVSIILAFSVVLAVVAGVHGVVAVLPVEAVVLMAVLVRKLACSTQ